MAGIVLVRDIMSKDVRVVRLDSSVKEVVATMNKFDIGSIIVVQGDRPVGIITERDILRRVVEPCFARNPHCAASYDQSSGVHQRNSQFR